MRLQELQAYLKKIEGNPEIQIIVDAETLAIEDVLWFKDDNVVWISVPDVPIGLGDDDDEEDPADSTSELSSRAAIPIQATECKISEDTIRPRTIRARQA